MLRSLHQHSKSRLLIMTNTDPNDPNFKAPKGKDQFLILLSHQLPSFHCPNWKIDPIHQFIHSPIVFSSSHQLFAVRGVCATGHSLRVATQPHKVHLPFTHSLLLWLVFHISPLFSSLHTRYVAYIHTTVRERQT